jgi:H+/gluconate symporter-like permease
MSIYGSWVATFAFLFVVFLIGLFLQKKERADRLNRKAEESIRREMMRKAMPEEPSRFGTKFGSTTQYEKSIPSSSTTLREHI